MRLMDQLGWGAVTDERLRFYRAVGVDSLLLHLPPEIADGTDRTADFVAMRERVAAHGLTLGALHLHQLPKGEIVYGGPEREAQLARWPSRPQPGAYDRGRGMPFRCVPGAPAGRRDAFDDPVDANDFSNATIPLVVA